MNVNWNSAATASLWANHHAQQKQNVETTGSIASNNNNSIFKNHNAETTGAVAMFGGLGGASQDGHFMAVA